MIRKTVIAVLSLLALSSTSLLAQDKADIQPVDVYIRSAKIALATKPPEYKRALRNLNAAREHYPDNYNVHYLLGSIWADKDEIDSMIVEWDLTKKYATEKEWKKLAKKLAKIYESKWYNRFDRAVKLVNQSDSTEESIPTLEDPSQADTTMWKVTEIRRMAKEALRQCTLLKPDDFRAYSTRGLVYQRQGLLDSSLADFVKAESLFHRNELLDSTTNWYDTTSFFSGPEGKPTDLFKKFQKKLKKLSDEKRNRYRNMVLSLITVYYDLEMWPETIVLARRFLGMEPDHINSIVTIADVFSRLEMEDEAFNWQEVVVRRNPDSKDTWYNMGIFYYNTAVRLQDSVSKYEVVVQDNPSDEAATALLLQFTKKRLENFAKAVPRFVKVVEIDEKDEDTWRLLAICRYSKASLSDAVNSLNDEERKREILDPVFPEGFDRIVVWTEAEKSLMKATDLFPDDKNLCRMMKISLAQLRKMDELKAWTPRCP